MMIVSRTLCPPRFKDASVLSGVDARTPVR
jgi:hypothetical protein